MDKMILVSADGHAGAQISTYRDYMDKNYIDALDDLEKENEFFTKMGVIQTRYSESKLDLIDKRGAIRSGGLEGAWNMKRRAREMDAEGIAGEILIPGHQLCTLPYFGMVNDPAPAELRAAGSRAYHRWLADEMSDASGRFVGVADSGPCLDMQATLEELKWVANHGFVSVSPPGTILDPNLPYILDPYFDPFWAACSDMELVLTLHGYGLPQIDKSTLMNSMRGNSLALDDEKRLEKSQKESRIPEDDYLGMAIYGTRQFLWQMMLGGVFDRFPKLKVVCTEIRADWVPATLKFLDTYFSQSSIKLKMKPSEYWAQHCFVVPSSPRRHEIDMRSEIGVNQLMLGVDYPHPEGMWPNTLDWIRATFSGVDEEDARLILGENAIRCYGLDRSALAKAADQIGLIATAVLSGEKLVKPELVKDFHDRADYLAKPENVDLHRVENLLDKDISDLHQTRL